MDAQEYDLERRKLRHLKWATIVTSTIALAAAGVSGLAVYSSLQWQAGLFKIQLAQNPQDFYCSKSVEVILSEDLVNEGITQQQFEGVCEKIQKLAPSLEVQRELVSLLAANPNQRGQILASYHVLYGKEATWIDNIADAPPG